MEILSLSHGGKAEHSVMSVDARIDEDIVILTATEKDYDDYQPVMLQGEQSFSKEFEVINRNFDRAFLFRCIRDMLLENNCTHYTFTEADIRY